MKRLDHFGVYVFRFFNFLFHCLLFLLLNMCILYSPPLFVFFHHVRTQNRVLLLPFSCDSPPFPVSHYVQENVSCLDAVQFTEMYASPRPWTVHDRHNVLQYTDTRSWDKCCLHCSVVSCLCCVASFPKLIAPLFSVITRLKMKFIF